MTTTAGSKNQTKDETKDTCGDEAHREETLIEIRDKSPDFEPTEESFIEVEGSLLETGEKLPLFEFGGYMKLPHKKAIYGVEFCNYLRSDEPVIFATVGSNNVTIFECKDDELKILQTYLDPDQTEIFFTCCWSYNSSSLHTVLAFGGLHGIIRLIQPMSLIAPQILIGHYSAIHDLKIHPIDSSILLSASLDHTLRLWNIESGQCIAIFGGANGHTDQIISADFNSTGNKIVSTGGDYSLKIWHIDKWPISQLIQSSFYVPIANDRPFRTVTIHHPDFTTRDVHYNIVDCVKWFGSSILSKATDNTIVCWTPGSVTKNSNYLKVDSTTVIQRFYMKNCNYWFIRFALDSAKKYLAVGNTTGDIYVWSLNNQDPTKSTILRHEQCTSTIRQTAFSPDGKILIAVSDNSCIYRWNMK